MKIFTRERKKKRRFRRQPGERSANSDLKEKNNQVVVFELKDPKNTRIYLDYVNDITVRTSKGGDVVPGVAKPDDVIIYEDVPTVIWELIERVALINIKLEEKLDALGVEAKSKASPTS